MYCRIGSHGEVFQPRCGQEDWEVKEAWGAAGRLNEDVI